MFTITKQLMKETNFLICKTFFFIFIKEKKNFPKICTNMKDMIKHITYVILTKI